MQRRFGFALAAVAVALLVLFAGLRLSHGAGAADPPAVSEGAKKEGVVVWYATMNTKDMALTVNRFEATHPGITVQTLRVGSAQLPARVITEQRGGKFNADVISGDELQVSQLIAAGAFDKYSPTEANKFVKGTVDANGYWVNLYQNTTVIAWNPARLAADHLKAPSNNADFARPEWKGKFGIDSAAFNWYLGTLQGGKNGADLIAKIAANGPVLTSGHTATVTQLESGEFDATPTAYGYLVDQEHEQKRPIAYLNTNPLLVTLNPVGLAKDAPHPNAARVFIEWLLSKDGQQWIAQEGGGEISSRTDVTSNPRIWNPRAPYVIVRAPDPSTYNDAVRTFRQLFGIPG